MHRHRPLGALAAFFFATAAHAGWESIGRVQSIERQSNGVILRTSQGLVAVSALSPEILRVRYTPQAQFGREHSWAVAQRDFGSVKTDIAIADDAIDLTTSTLRMHIARDPLRIETFDAQGRSLDADDAEQGLSHAGARLRLAKRLRDDEHVYGFGEKTGRLDKRGTNLGGTHYAMWNTDTPAYDASADPLYVSVPFYLVLRDGVAHGVFLDNAWRTSFDVGKDARDLLTLGADGGELDYYLIAGPDPKAVIERYTALTGRMPMPPRWALGYQQSRWSYYPESRVRLLADTFRAKQVPADGLWLDIDYQRDFKPFTWNHERFADPARLMGDLGHDGFHVVTILDPHPTREPGYSIYDEGLAGEHFVKRADGSVFAGPVWPSQAKEHGGDSVFPDFTRGATREWWGKHYRSLLDVGIAGIWNDMNEPAVWIKPASTMPNDLRHDNDGEPADHAAVHNVYGMQFSRSTFEGLQAIKPDARPFVLTRASFAGGQRYAAVWTGDNTSDWSSLRQSLPMLMGLGVSGFPFVGADVGGFIGTPSGELYSRWLQAAVFSPFFRSHTETNSPEQEPWSYGTRYEAINRRTIELRYRLFPQLYTVMEEASRTGVPALRPLFLEFPADAESTGRDDEFLFGADLLVAPVLFEAAAVRDVYLPPGQWYAFDSGQRLDGAQTLHVPVSADSLSIYVRAGAFVVAQPVVQNTGEMRGQPLTVQVYPASQSQGTLYEDDGASLGYRRGDFARRHFAQERSETAIHLGMSASEGSYRVEARTLSFELLGVGEVSRVDLDGKRIDANGKNAQWSLHDGRLRVTLQDRREAVDLRITLKVPK